MRSGGTSAALSALALTGGFTGAAGVPVGLAVELGDSAVFVSAWSAILELRNLVLGKQYKYKNQTDVYIPAEPLCQADFGDCSVTFRSKDKAETSSFREGPKVAVSRQERNATVYTALHN